MVVMAHGARLCQHALAAALAMALLGGLSACSEESPRGSAPTPTRRASLSASPSADISPSAEPTSSPVKNDLERVPLARSLNAGPVRVDVKYMARLPLTEWRAGTTKPLLVTLTASNRNKRNQKIYLTRVTMNVTAFDESGQLDVPQAIVDSANLQPGFIVKSPNTYNQNFDIPAVDRAAVRITIDLSYELLLEVNRSDEGVQDLAKQVATDRLSVPIVTS